MSSQKTKRDIKSLKTKISKAQTSHNATNGFKDFTIGQIAICLDKLEQLHERWISYDYMSGLIVHYDMYLETLNTLLVDAKAHLFEQRRLELEPRTPSPDTAGDNSAMDPHPNVSDDDHVSIVSGGRPSEHDDDQGDGHDQDVEDGTGANADIHNDDPDNIDDPVTDDDNDLNNTAVFNDPDAIYPGTRTPTPDPPRNTTPTGPRPSTPRLQTPPPAPPVNPVTGGFRFTLPNVRPTPTRFRPTASTAPTIPTVPQPTRAFRPVAPSPTTYNTYNPYCPPPGYPQYYQQPQPQPIYYQVPPSMPTSSAAEDLLHKMVANAETQQKQMSQLVQCFEKIASQGSRSGSHRSTPLSHRSTPTLQQQSSGPPPVKPKPTPSSSGTRPRSTKPKPPATTTTTSDANKPKDTFGSLLTMLSEDESDSTDSEIENVYKKADEALAKITPHPQPARTKEDSDSVVEKLLKHMAADREAAEQARRQEWKMTLQAIHKGAKLAKPDVMKVQDIPIPSFSGDPDEYEYFKTTFDSLIGSRRDKTPKEKAIRLSMSLKGTAASVAQPLVKGGTFEDTTYEAMWTLLDSYFGDDSRVQNNKLKKFMSHPPMPHWSHSAILDMSVNINEFILYSKRAQPSWIDGNTPAYTSTRDKMPKAQVANYTRWVLSLRQQESLELLYEWLMMELKAEQAADDSQRTFKKEKSPKAEKAETSTGASSTGKASKSKTSTTIKQLRSDTSASSDSDDFAKDIENTIKAALNTKKVAFKDVNIEKPTSSTTFATMKPTLKSPNTCIYCKDESHLIYECPTWIDLRNTKKYTWLGITSGCYHCLQTGHYARDCTFKKDIACGHNGCKRYHHVTLHPTKQDVVNAMWEEDFLPDDQINYLTSESI